MRAGSIPAPTNRSSKSIRSSTDSELASEFVPNTARPTFCDRSHRHCRTNRSGSGERSALNGVTTGDSTPEIRFVSVTMCLLLWNEHDLAEVSRFHHRLVGARCLGERKLLTDHRPERAVPEPLHERGVDAGELAGRTVEQRHAEDRRILVHGQSRIDLHHAAVADDHDTSPHGDDPEILLEVDVGKHLEHHVDASATGQAHHLVEVTWRGVVDDMMRALLHHEPPATVRPGRADHGHASRPRELDGSDPDAAARAE